MNKTVAVSIPVDLYNKIESEGKENERKISTHIRFILKEYFDKKDENKSGEGK